MAILGVAFVFVFVLFVFVFVIMMCQGIGRTRNVLQRTASLAGNGSSHFRFGKRKLTNIETLLAIKYVNIFLYISHCKRVWTCCTCISYSPPHILRLVESMGLALEP